MNTAYDGQERVRPSGRNGNRLPLRKPGERIGGRQKGTPNKMSPEFKEALVAAAVELARGARVSKADGLQAFLVKLGNGYPKGFYRLLLYLIASKKSRGRERTWMTQPSCTQEVQKRCKRTVVS
jgi:hypothetical protein